MGFRYVCAVLESVALSLFIAVSIQGNARAQEPDANAAAATQPRMGPWVSRMPSR